MANKLAGQRAKFSRAHATFFSTSSETERQRAAKLMAEVVRDAPANGFTEAEVTQGAEVPEPARLALGRLAASEADEASDEENIALLRQHVDISDVVEIGEGPESVYAYGYFCAPDRLKIGMATGDAIARVATQIGTSTPDRPKLLLVVRTPRARAYERALHSILELRDRRIRGGGAEWFRVTREEVLELVRDLERMAVPSTAERVDATSDSERIRS